MFADHNICVHINKLKVDILYLEDQSWSWLENVNKLYKLHLKESISIRFSQLEISMREIADSKYHIIKLVMCKFEHNFN